MTLIVGIRCDDGVVIGADSAATDLQIGIKQPVQKIKQCKDCSILYACSGDVGLMQKINELLEANCIHKVTIRKTIQEIKKHVIPIQKQAIVDHVPYPTQQYHAPPSLALLFTGVISSKPWIVEIEPNGNDTFYGDELGNFHAIGSGGAFAQAVFRPYLSITRDLNLGKTLAYRIIDDAIELSAMGLSHPIHIHTISSHDGSIQEIDDDEKYAISDTCDIWRQLQREVVGDLLSTNNLEKKEAELELPKP